MIKKLGFLPGFMTVMLAALLLFPGFASAHAYIVKSSPAENEVLAQPPAKAVIHFNEPLQKAFHSIKVTNSSGKTVNLSESRIPEGENSVLEADLQPDLQKGVYAVQWKAVSADGHPVEGTFSFQIGTGGGSTGDASHTVVNASDWPGTDLVIIRWLFYTSLAFLAGIYFFQLYLLPAGAGNRSAWSGRSIRLMWINIAVLAASFLLSLPLQTGIDAGVGWSGVWSDPSLLLKMLRITSFGEVWMVQLILLVLITGLAAALPKMKDRDSAYIARTVSFLLVMGMLLAKSFIGHPAASEYKALGITMDFLHLGAASLWLGSLLAFAVLLPKEASLPADPEDRKKSYFAVIRRFSLWGTIFVVLILISGIYASLQYVPTWYSLFHTSYGKILYAKGIMMLIMIACAFWNLLRGKEAKDTLKAGVWLELAAGVIALVLAAALTNMPTGSTSPGPVHMEQTLENKNVIQLDITPNVTGVNEFQVKVEDSKGQPVKGIQQIKLTLTSLDMDMGKYEIVMPGGKAEGYKAQDLITMAGKWNVHVHVLTDQLETWDSDMVIHVGNR
ncbi:copper resistance protein CopC [Paenibacillus sp. HJL G12]|uniref:Copper resistance protein CopC n=1 Tax=Paenibacillus dendrobii TaxID=2691084 RepID=A0A7X3IM04_9BACL|nr:copper resistance protein CopC [Paenibacillus dendrobii]MWV45896.1 copper resistance protein CopC [Paenibacillus dendrobii]